MTKTNEVKRVTKRERYNQILAIPAVAENEELTAFVEHEIELLNRKNSGEKKLTATQKANEEVKAEMLAQMNANPDHLYSVSEIQKSFACCEGMANQKVSALLGQLKKAELIERIEDKRKAYFRAVKTA